MQQRDRGDNKPNLRIVEVVDCVNHWNGQHYFCALFDPQRPCCINATIAKQIYFAITECLESHICLAKMRRYTCSQENFLSETFHSLINKYTIKCIHWKKITHEARLACTALDWNENWGRELLGTCTQSSTNMVVRHRPTTSRILSVKIKHWKEEVSTLLFGRDEAWWRGG